MPVSTCPVAHQDYRLRAGLDEGCGLGGSAWGWLPAEAGRWQCVLGALGSSVGRHLQAVVG